MSRRPSDRSDAELPPDLRPDAWSHRIAEVYEPPPMSPARRAAFDARLRERTESASGWTSAGFVRPLAVALAAAALLVGALSLRPVTPVETELVDSTEQPAAVVALDESEVEESQEQALLAITSDAIVVSDESLPADYAAIEGLFFGG